MNSPARQHAVVTAPRRCLTLMETLITIVLLLALAAVAAPIMLDRIDERAFESAADHTHEQLLMARAHAQSTGEAVEVTYSPSTGHVQARRYAPWNMPESHSAIEPGTSPLIDATNAGPDTAVSPGGPLARGSGDQEPQQVIAEGWASRVLGRGIRIQTSQPGSEADDQASLAGGDFGSPDGLTGEDFETLEDLANGQEVRLAVFMPDGSAMVGENLWLNDESGRRGRIVINPWSGLPMFQRMADADDGANAGAVDESLSQLEDQSSPASGFDDQPQQRPDDPARDADD